jgi:hypothetical protein
MYLEGFEFPALVKIDGDPPPIGLHILLSTKNLILANCKLRPAKAHVLLWGVASGHLGDPFLGGGGDGHCTQENALNFSVRVGLGVLLVLCFFILLGIDIEGHGSGRGDVKQGLSIDVIGLRFGALLGHNIINCSYGRRH